MINLMGPSLSFSLFLLRLSFCLFCLYASVCFFSLRSVSFSLSSFTYVSLYLYITLALIVLIFLSFLLSVFLSVFFIIPVSPYLPFPSFSSVSYTFHSPWNVSQELFRNISPFFCHFISNYHFSFLDGDKRKRNLFDNFFFSKLFYLPDCDWSDSLLICQIFFQFFVSCEWR